MENYKISTDDKVYGFYKTIGEIYLDNDDPYIIMHNEINGKYYIDLYEFGLVDLALLPDSEPKSIAIKLIQAID